MNVDCKGAVVTVVTGQTLCDAGDDTAPKPQKRRNIILSSCTCIYRSAKSNLDHVRGIISLNAHEVVAALTVEDSRTSTRVGFIE